MNGRNVMAIAGKEFRVGPRGLMFVFLVLFPFLITFLIRLIFGDLLAPAPRLGIVDEGSSRIIELARTDAELEVTVYPSVERLHDAVAGNDEDAGLVLQPDFDRLVRSGAMPELQLVTSGQADEIDAAVIAVTVINIVRQTAGQPAPVEVIQVTLGEGPTVPLEERFVPLLVLIAVAFGGVFLPAATIVQEREARTLQALLVTPLRVEEVMLGKGIVGFLLAFGVGAVTLLINGGLSVQNLEVLVVIAVAALMSVEIGLMLGAAVSNMGTLFSVWKSGGVVLFAPAILFLFPGVPEWIARVFPTYYFLGPLQQIVVHGARLAGQSLDLGIALAICAALAVVTGALSRRMESRLAAG